MSEQPSTKVTIHQDILIKMATPGDSSSENSSNKKRRVTFSSLYFDEEPVFSDSEDEKEYMKRIFGEPLYLSQSKSPKNQEVGIQCNIISEKDNFIELMEKCFGMKPEVISKSSVVEKYSNQLINLCKQIQHELLEEFGGENFEKNNSLCREFTRKEQNIISNNTDVPSEEFLPSRSGNNNSLSKIISVDELVPSKPSVCDELLLKTKKRKYSKRNYHMQPPSRSSMREKKSPDKRFKMEIEPVDKRTFLKKKNNRVKSDEFSRREPKSKNISKPRQKSKEDEAVPENVTNSEQTMNGSVKSPMDMSKYLMNPDLHFKLPLPSKLVRPLARNWMKPNKSLPLEAIEVQRLPTHYASLQQEKQRYLYSPSRWLESDEFLRSIAQEQKIDSKTVHSSV